MTFWRALLKLKRHIGKILWAPLLLSSGMFVLQIAYDYLDDGILDHDELHKLASGANSLEMVILVVAMALLKGRTPPRA